jgi:hypothetical protein
MICTKNEFMTTDRKIGMYPDIDFKQYRAEKDWVSISELNTFRKAPICYENEYINNNKRKQTPQMELGTALHMMFESRELFNKTYQAAAKIDKRTKAGQEEAEKRELLEKRAGIIFLDPTDMNKVELACASLEAHPFVAQVKKDLKSEVSMFWHDDDAGTLCKGRVDAYSTLHDGIFDVKTTKDASNFDDSVVTYGYHRQAAYYLDGFQKTSGIKLNNFYWLCVEMEAPYLCSVYVADAIMLDVGRHEYKNDLKRFADCKKKNSWPGLSSEVKKMSLPSWYLRRATEIII